jgi:5-methylcytosine-specific restriction protein A
MRRSLKTNTLVLISNHVGSIYDDRWIDGIFHYTGMGQIGDQTLQGNQNKTLAESVSNGVEIHLFEVEREAEYIYQGRVELAEELYQEIQADLEGNNRKVFVFPLRLSENEQSAVAVEQFNDAQKRRQRKAKKLSDEEVRSKAIKASGRAGERRVQSVQFERDPYVSEYVKRVAGGTCDLCGEPAPFRDKKQEPYLECHHVVWLSKGGDDAIENTVALCPNCHRRMHIMDDDADKQMLLIRIDQRDLKRSVS